MKKPLQNLIMAVLLFLLPTLTIAQAPPLGAASDFTLFTSVGAMENVGTYQYLTLITGDVGTNSGSNTNFGNVNGVMHAGDGATGQCAIDLQAAYDFLADAIPDSTIENPVLGNNSTLKPGTYLLPGATSLEQSLTLDAQGDADAVFIIKMPSGSPVYAFNTSTNAQVNLVNGAQASNVFWFITGAVNMGTSTIMKGTIIAGGSISMSADTDLEGRALTINGSVTVSNGDIGLSAYLPVDISTPLPTGPAAPVFVESGKYAVFSSIGDVSDDGTSHVTGSVGSNSALPTGFDPLFVSGDIEGMNTATAGGAADLTLVYNSLSNLAADIELLAPAQFGHNLVLTPNAYVMNSAVSLTDTIILDAKGNADAVFIIKTYGAFESSVHSNVMLMNGTQAKNVFWMVNGSVSIGDSSSFNGNIVVNNGAIDLLKGSSLSGRALTTNGSISTTGMTAEATEVGIDPINSNRLFTIYPNPFSTLINVRISSEVKMKSYEMRIYNILGVMVLNTTISNDVTSISASNLSSGVYFYYLIGNEKTIQSGKLISKQ
ncbi:MAG: ice-binding family protein [Salinivirgaceae bacterium]